MEFVFLGNQSHTYAHGVVFRGNESHTCPWSMCFVEIKVAHMPKAKTSSGNQVRVRTAEHTSCFQLSTAFRRSSMIRSAAAQRQSYEGLRRGFPARTPRADAAVHWESEWRAAPANQSRQRHQTTVPHTYACMYPRTSRRCFIRSRLVH